MSVKVLAPSSVQKFWDNNGFPLAFGFLTTLAAGTNTPQASYKDSVGTLNTNPIQLNARGECSLWLDPLLTYKFALTDVFANPIPGWPVDNIPGGPLALITADLLPTPTNTVNLGGASNTFKNLYLGPSGVSLLNTASGNMAFYAQTQAESNASLAIVDYTYPVGNMLRYGVVPNSVGAGAANLAICRTMFNPSIANGPTGNFYFPNTTGQDVYYIGAAGASCVVAMRDGCRLDLQQCTLIFNGTGSSPTDNNSGCLFFLRDTQIKNGSIVVNWATGASTSSGNAIQMGARGPDSSYFSGIWDSLLSTPMGNNRLEHLRITINASGANLSSVGAVAFVGGLKGVIVDDVFVNGSGTLTQGFVQEFGWATNDTQPSARQSSHMSDFVIRNCRVSNMDNASILSGGIILAAAYQGVIENYSFTGVSNGVISSAGESFFYRPWAGVDDITSKHVVTLRNITGINFSNAGLNLSGSQPRSAGTGYLQRAWVALTAYGIRETVINGGNMYVVTSGGVSGNTGGPTGTTTSTEGTVTWAYVPLTANTDQIDYVVDGNCNLNGNSGAGNIVSSAGYLTIKGSCTLTGGLNSIFLFAECTRFSFEGIRSSGAQGVGMELGTSSGAIWSPVRLKTGTIRDCYIYGNSVASAGAQPGININNCISVLVDNSRINLDSAYNGVAETTQGNGVQVGTNAFGVRCRNCHIGNTVGGGSAAYASTASTGILNDNDIVTPNGNFSIFGPWNNDSTGNATTANLGSKTSNINTVGKYFGRRCFNSSNNRLLIATGPNNTDNWAYCDGNAPATITPV